MSIVLDSLSKTIQNHAVLDQISLELTEGEFFVLLGASGSGKSTILRLIAGLTFPDTGKILLNGKDVTDWPPQKRGVGFVFQNYSIFRHMSVGANVEFGLKIRKIPPEERARKREQLLDLVGLSGLDKRYANQLSGGQLQRVALARALAFEPNILLLDEPFGALDSRIRSQLRRSLREIQQRLKVTTILVTHDQEEAFALADRIGIMERGRLLEIGRPESLYSRPKTLFAATFLGAGTVLAGKADEGFAKFGPLSLPIPVESPRATGSKVHVLFRPEQVMLSSEKPDSEAATVGLGTIAERVFSGSSLRVRLKLPHLQETRQIAPHVPFGEEGLLIDASVPSGIGMDRNEAWVSLRSWHILDEPHPRLLVYAGKSESGNRESCLALVRELSDRMYANAVMLGVAEDRDSVEAMEIFLLHQKKSHDLVNADLQISFGNPTEQIIRMQQDGSFDLLILGADHHTNTILGELLNCCTIPVLVARPKQRSIGRILICTAAGEPGKTDVRVGGRFARRLNASVTLLHIAPKDAQFVNPIANAHLQHAIATLRGLDVEGAVRIRNAEMPSEGILAESKEGDYDLIVVGGHGPKTRSIFAIEDVTMKVLNATDRPVLVVPIENE